MIPIHRALRAGVGKGRRVFGACSGACLLLFCNGMMPVLGQTPVTVHGHVLHAPHFVPCSDAAVQAWPCGTLVFTDADGRFEAFCPGGVDSLTVMSHGHRVSGVAVNGRAHVDIELEALSVDLEHAEIDGRTSEYAPEAAQMKTRQDLLATLESVPGVRGLDLGAGLIQPVFRGLLGARVAVLEDGIPQVGGRWGADHGVLMDPELYGGAEAVPGGGHVWLGPEAMGGAVRLSSFAALAEGEKRTRLGTQYRWGDSNARLHVLHRQRKDRTQWHAGWSARQFGNRNVPQSAFQYLGRQYRLDASRLPNTSGQALHGVLGIRSDAANGWGSLEMRWSEARQGLFPGIIGVPDQQDLTTDPDVMGWELPLQLARRLQLTGKWTHHGVLDRTLRLSVSRNERGEFAPPHAHGFGPEPSDDLSLRLEERYAFGESRWEGAQGAFGVQMEWLEGRTTGWEFLLPDHTRQRFSLVLDREQGRGRLGLRLDAVHVTHAAHSEPLYGADGAQIGVDVRTDNLNRWMPGGALSWHLPLTLRPHVRGHWTTALYSRAPSSYALAANGIHHGTFRFEQGNPGLRPEQSLETRLSMGSPEKAEGTLGWSVQAFAALHRGFIHLTPKASFAPIAHAGQIYGFEARDAFRTGLEGTMLWGWGNSRWEHSLALLGQWALETGLGLPFTPPADLRSRVQHPWGENGFVAIQHRWVAEARLVARNEAATPGASLWGFQCGWSRSGWTVSLEADNIANVAWLDHVSAYRALGLVSQGRWASLRLTLDVGAADDR